MTKLLILISLCAGCVEHLALEPLACPCSAGWTCCATNNTCLRDSATCPAPTPPPDQTCEPNAPAGETLSAGGSFTCGIKTDGHLACWGNVAPTPPSGTFTSVAVGNGHGCGIHSNGTLACWGTNVAGETRPPAGTFVQVSVQGYSSCAVATDGTIACWGMVPPAPAGSFRMVAVTDTDNACALTTDDTVVCWGANENGEATPPSGTFAAIDGGNGFVCGLRHDGARDCWGFQSGHGSNGYRLVSAGNSHSCALRCDGTIECWGSNVNGELNAPSGIFKSVSAGAIHNCALDELGTVVCWGDNHYDELAVPDVTFRH